MQEYDVIEVIRIALEIFGATYFLDKYLNDTYLIDDVEFRNILIQSLEMVNYLFFILLLLCYSIVIFNYFKIEFI